MTSMRKAGFACFVMSARRMARTRAQAASSRNGMKRDIA
jgi:hypothetical protein